jgi:hypothetical protein
MLKFENQEDYQWCMNMDEAAYEISIRMNTSRQEVKDTYSSLHIRDESASMPHVKPTTTFVLPDSDEEEDETPPNVSANRHNRLTLANEQSYVTPARFVNRKRSFSDDDSIGHI